MADKEKRKGGGGKLSRSETVTVRMDPKQRYLAELAARQQRRTLSSFIEWSIDQALGTVKLDSENTVADSAERLWDVDEPDRFVALAFNYENLLTHEEQVLWKLIRENGHLWRGKYDSRDEWTWQTKPGHIAFKRLRENWRVLTAVAKGEIEKDPLLPLWAKETPED